MSIGLQFGSVIDHPCPSDELLAAYVDDTTLASSKLDNHNTFEDAIFNGYVVASGRALSNAERQRVDEHLNYCPRCYKLVSETRSVLQIAERDKEIVQDEVREEYRKLFYEMRTDFMPE